MAPDLSVERTALVISECQRGILDPELTIVPSLAQQAAARGTVARIAVLAAAFRRADRPVVYCTIAHRPDFAGVLPNSLLGSMTLKHRRMVVGTDDVDVPVPIAPQPTDFVSSRATGITAFYGTDLDATLRLQSITTVVICGVSTDIALPGMALEAVNRGYRVVMAEDATAGTSAASHAFMTTNVLAALAQIRTVDEVVAALADEQAPHPSD
ncbi:MAG TPA: cysteine hydrolase [Acidimicrobiales bacterium]|jgi:nicotinamidase-related amidase|nr:cysteine hydrolase [Acidimicrobiales bacterium]